MPTLFDQNLNVARFNFNIFSPLSGQQQVILKSPFKEILQIRHYHIPRVELRFPNNFQGVFADDKRKDVLIRGSL